MARHNSIPSHGDYADAEHIARRQGFNMARVTGSHSTWEHPDGRKVTIARGHRGDMAKGTWCAIMKVLVGAGVLVGMVACALVNAPLVWGW